MVVIAGSTRRLAAGAVAFLILTSSPRSAQDLPSGVVIDAVPVAADPAQSYALYLPSDYARDRTWSLLLAFHPSARGVAFVETYRAAAERYGYIVAGSNNSRNGSWTDTIRAVRAMSGDVGRRFSVDAQRVYVTGHSGGARVAMEVALGNVAIAGVIASSAGFPDARPRRSVAFPVFGTVGVEDFNYLEMRRLDERLTSPHYLAVFDGGHVLPPDSVAVEAVEWLELQAMRTGRRTKDPALIEALFTARAAHLRAGSDLPAQLRALRALVADFTGLRDTKALQVEADDLAKNPLLRSAQSRDRAGLDAESRMLDEALQLEARLRDPAARGAALARLQALFESWSKSADASAPSPDRARARRLMSAISAGAAERVEDDDYRALVQKHRR